MAKLGVKYVLCLGVDFMSENCRAVLDMNGYQDVAVYRLCSEQIGPLSITFISYAIRLFSCHSR